MTEADKLRKEYRESVGSTYNMKFEWYADWLEQQLIKARQQVNSVDLADVVKPKGTFCVWCKKNEQLDFTAICKECYDNYDR